VTAAGFDPESLRASLKPLVPGEPTVLTPEQDRFLRHYGIHFSESVRDVAHWFGRIDSPTHALAAHLWRPRAPAGTTIVLHGYYDHVGLYRNLIGHLIDHGQAVLSFDLPGHGLSNGPAATIDTFDHYVSAFDACMTALGPHLPKPWHLAGQSTGAAVAMEWLLRNGLTRANSSFEHVVLLAPLVRPAHWGINRVVYGVARRFVKERPRSLSDNADNPEFLTFLRERDPLQATTLPVQWVTAMVDWMQRFETYKATDLAPLVIQGQSDKTVDWRYNMKVIERLFRPQIVYIPEARHHLVNESEGVRARMFAAIDRFMFSDQLVLPMEDRR
jgi:alpha-beta hydrolase superfamily lysophospholipase